MKNVRLKCRQPKKIELIFGNYFYLYVLFQSVLYSFLLVCFGIFCWNCSIKVIIKRWFSICFVSWRSLWMALLVLNRSFNVLGLSPSLHIFLHFRTYSQSFAATPMHIPYIVISNCHQTRYEESTNQKRNEKQRNEERNCPITHSDTFKSKTRPFLTCF